MVLTQQLLIEDVDGQAQRILQRTVRVARGWNNPSSLWEKQDADVKDEDVIEALKFAKRDEGKELSPEEVAHLMEKIYTDVRRLGA